MYPFWLELASYAGIGILSGFFAGLLGIGGGAIIAPLLILIYSNMLSFSADFATYMAIATALGVIVLTAPVSALSHIRQNNINWRLAFFLSIGTTFGAIIGGRGAILLPADLLKLFLIGFLFNNSFLLLFPRHRKPSNTISATEAKANTPATKLLPVSFFFGAFSAVIGIGGGALTVPYLYRRQIPIHLAIGTSAFMVFPLAVAASIGYVWASIGNSALPSNSFGYIYIPALLSISLFAMVSAYVGARLSLRLPADKLRKIFGLLTAIIALRLLWSIIAAL
ncbi:MAG: sulfite exporter TauE/SafE family protein [Proteobacteria bacterium]|nr:sulfite exporter TauE/SafE family protein [Pseudomonadota bacterium]MCH9758182.1 sulfite exporter TauE/SafE family protein [Pseudomonadota bacterium]